MQWLPAKQPATQQTARGLAEWSDPVMKIRGIVWLGTRTEHFEEMVAFCREVMGLAQSHLEPGFAIFDLANGDRMEVFGKTTEFNTFMTHPVAGFLVDHIVEARAEMEGRGIEFIGPIHDTPNGYAWTHFRAPDGFVYELTLFPGHPAS
jgi:catechol 2,3-dioxygenase-like lactoylglutathione lyase family enzyme